MKDPVPVCSGITYDRVSIEQWIFCSKNKTFPITREPLPELDMTPNHTLRRLIQAWCVANVSNGVERIPTPKPPVDKVKIIKLLEEVMNEQTQIKSLQNLKSIATESERNKRLIEASGAVGFLASIVKNNSTSIDEAILNAGGGSTRASDEALTILYSLQLSEEGFRHLAGKSADFVASLAQVMQAGDYKSRAYATSLLKSIFKVLDPVHLLRLRVEILQEIVNVIRDQISQQATKAALVVLLINNGDCKWHRYFS